MCGRFTLTTNQFDIMDAFHLDNMPEDYEPRYNVAPGQNVLVVIHDGNKTKAGTLKWGLVPSWAKDPSIGYKMINARLETAPEKPSFKRLIERRRCLIVADSFYEWKKEGKKKQPVRISLTNRKLFSFAGLWDRWVQNEKEIVSCTILTKEPNDFMTEIHNRMPVILPKEAEKEWIEPEKKDGHRMKEFLLSLNDEKLVSYEVSSYVNNAKNDGPDCILPLV
ncbi:SOS response-associated peptidase [Salirhabdus salicampi]|uniref:SOS response-associated peptidase n=1 Tax=Salirhabdus salicampi TaxID=476102 RepID=UPI0020C33F90|nr:SOS response-associated peptidase [Salirhabdus salicampi]MCP8617905.1 SOS response-associated peptidase [Salirhabdus salicampi]